MSSGAVALPEAVKQEMYDIFQSWALKNYGDSGKTKTVTKRKYDRIVNILAGDELSTADNSKFRFWVKAKGFRLGPLEGVKAPPLNDDEEADTILYVPTKVPIMKGKLIRVPQATIAQEEKGYKRVAIVENFFDIIYDVHVEMDGRGGKHAGQKRTYRAIAETYAFLPREAVTRFLMSCAHCQKRMHVGSETNNNQNDNQLSEQSLMKEENKESDGSHSPSSSDPPLIDFSLPITTTYLNHMRQIKGYSPDVTDDHFVYNNEDSMSSADSEMSGERSSSPAGEETSSPKALDTKMDTTSAENSRISSPVNLSSAKGGQEADGSFVDQNGNAALEKGQESRGHPERKRRSSDELSVESSTRASESGLLDDGCKDDDDDNDDDDDDKMPSKDYDPERLKAFNMFVRLFVDENLDRVVPISKQPKDKIQAILEACHRQFPEFQERSRKRIRTYLKSCRRLRRSKDQNGWDQKKMMVLVGLQESGNSTWNTNQKKLRPTPPHLTSAAAEGLLAQACDNESQNAKRMRMGLEPNAHLSFQTNAMPPPTTNNSSSSSASSHQTSTPQAAPQPSPSPHSQSSTPQPAPIERPAISTADFVRAHAPPTAFRPPHELPQPFFTNGNGLFRPGFAGYQHPAHHHPPAVVQPSQISSHVQNDLSLKGQTKSSKNQLNPTEVATIKQLIAGYRESAAFLYRSADELEQLLLQNN
ncbi:nucleolar protein 4-like isoform X2 [Lineus longissimus]|uniref:nucleolar protein 4-like isoform X2 n=1 Tax=Lineus longissimus TaxID=88925 RepID=UPI00315C7366